MALGGYLERRESFEACAARETLEETGLHISDINYFDATNDIFSEENQHAVDDLDESPIHIGRTASSEESAATGWMEPDDLPEP